MVNLETQDIQGIIVTGYGDLSFSSYLFLHIEDTAQAKSWLGQIIKQTTTAKWNTEPNGEVQKPQSALNIAFTWQGLQKLGLSAEVLETSFAQEFVEGIAASHRARRLGDTGASAPENWEIGGTSTAEAATIHALLITQAKTQDELKNLCQEQRTLLESSGVREVATAQVGYLRDDSKEHFGFHDSISQPEIEGSPKATAPSPSCIKAGEFILGYLNEYDVLPPTPTVNPTADVHNNLKLVENASPESDKPQPKDFGRNGSYLVFRQLQQDVAGFRRYIKEKSNDAEEMQLLAAKFVGRWPSGAPLVLAPDRDDENLGEDPGRNNAFGYMQKDPDGYRCPIGAHIRRTYPRDSLGADAQESLRNVNRHRILRRGALYGEPLPEGTFEDDGKPRGLLFFCINADIESQFEFIQQTWLNNPKFNGLYNDKDPLVGDNDGSGQMTIQREPVRQRLTDLPRFVSVKGGGYFFLPSISALYFLAGVKNPGTQESSSSV